MTPAECTLCLRGPNIAHLDLHHNTLQIVPKHGQILYRQLRKLSVILIAGELQQGLTALIACARANIPVGFFSLRGELLAILEPVTFTPYPLAIFINELSPASPESALLEEWLQGRLRNEYAKQGIPAKSLPQQQQLFRQQLAHWLRTQPLDHKQWRSARIWLDGLLDFFIASHLQRLHIAPPCFGYRQVMLGLQNLLRLRLLPQLQSLCLRPVSENEHFLRSGLAPLLPTIAQDLTQLLGSLENEFNRGCFYGHPGTLSDQL